MKNTYFFLVIFTIILSSYFLEKEKKVYDKKISNHLKDKIYQYTLKDKLAPIQDPQFFTIIGKAFTRIKKSGYFVELNLFNDTQKVVGLEKITLLFSKECGKKPQDFLIKKKLLPSKNTFISNIKISCPFIKKISYFFESKLSKNLLNIEFAKIPIVETQVTKLSKLTITTEKPFVINEYSTYIIDDLKIEKDVFLSFPKYSAFIIKNTIEINGKNKTPVIIKGKKESGGIFTDKAHMAKLKNVKIVGFSGGIYNSTFYPGALSFLRSQKIIMENIVMLDNYSEDTLHMHTVENFDVNNLKISNSLDDAFDTNNSTGRLSNSQFFNCGGDCVDFYHSHVNLKNIKTDTAADKGISIGELSNVFATNIVTKNSPIGIGIKDGSTLQISKSQLKAESPLSELRKSLITQNENIIKIKSTELINE